MAGVNHSQFSISGSHFGIITQWLHEATLCNSSFMPIMGVLLRPSLRLQRLGCLLSVVAAFEARKPSVLQKCGAVISRREQQIGPDRQAEVPEWQPPSLAANRRVCDGADANPLDPADEVAESARQTAALLTAAAFGPISSLCYVGPTDCDLGLFARCALPKDTPICEYAGPVLPRVWQRQHQGYNLGIPGGSGGVGSAEAPFFIDGASEQAPFPTPRSLGPYANHSSARPNARYEWRVAGAGMRAPSKI